MTPNDIVSKERLIPSTDNCGSPDCLICRSRRTAARDHIYETVLSVIGLALLGLVIALLMYTLFAP